MRHKGKFGYLAFVAALIVLPLRSFAEAQAPNSTGTAGSSSNSPMDKTDRDILTLSMSLSLSSFSVRQTAKPTSDGESSATVHGGAAGDSLPIKLSFTLTPPPNQSISRDGEINAAASDKSFSLRDDDINSRESLFGNIEPATEKAPHVPAWKKLVTGWRGFSQLEIADTYSSPEHFSKAKLRTELSRTGQFNEHIKWKISGRFDYDAAYDVSNFYPPAVRRDQRQEFFLRENYLDISAGNFDFRVGRQHVIWGEMVGLFFADVVSAKDMREFVLPAFDILRIPQWAVRAEYSKNDIHAEVLWIPVPTIDESGRPGADFYPGPLQGTAAFLPEDRSGRNIGNSNYGLRLSQLKNGWDISGFYYHSLDASPTFYRTSGFTEPLVFQARHDKIDQFGTTLAKDFGSIVLKGELVYTDGRKFNVARPTAINGLVGQNTLDYVLGLDFSLPAETRLNVQFFQRVFFSHDPGIVPDKRESGASILLAGKVWHNLEAQTLLIHSLNRSDWMLRPRLSWNFQRNWRWALGADVFGGEPTGLFGRFDQSDRVYTELRYSF
ncbi:hypothetical protein SAMN05216420_108128 [Nitrosospira sp. Nl5]|uniref:DUF1302 family protein n=1 Tax=Nitrosospira sp. Nl5 TaxID=200120 RepID=UPI000890E877|nr:DUF1302 family protein [Nitrosospira sp. Nl5]SCY55424.1 hypothetical protein SAMN05216420_108128 [Nitrosospira sp. Nl5]